MRAGFTAILLFIATAAAAEVVDRSPRPLANPVFAGVAVAAVEPVAVAPAADGMARSLRPWPRPASLIAKVAAARSGAPERGLDLAAPVEEELAAVAPPTRKELRQKKRAAASKKGSVCGIAAIKGEPIAPIRSRVKGCGVPEAVRITSVSGVQLSQAATIDCATAAALNTWVEQVVQPAYDQRVVGLQVAAHYICRSRNNKKGAKVSEHGKGKAIDISAFLLSDGSAQTVAGNYNRTMRKVHKSACGIFKTTLGPGSDGYHEDHLHLDTASHRSGTYCR